MRTRTSPAGRPSRDQGFTLLEVLVVLVIAGLAIALVPGFMLKGSEPVTLDQAAAALADQFRESRGRAIFQNEETLFALDVERGVYRTGETTTPMQIASDIAVSLVTARRERSGETSGRIRFFPDGSATGGRIVLSKASDRRIVEVDWLTGAISVESDGR